jgi:hypothetical protein
MLTRSIASQFLIVLFLGGCSAVIDQAPQPSENPPPYKQLIRAALVSDAKPDASNVSGLFPPITQIKNAYSFYEVSQPRQVNIVGGWTWQVCLKGNNKDGVVYVAVFIKDGSIVQVRTSVAIDKCGQEIYEPLS